MIQTEVKLAKAMELHRYNPFSEDGKFEHEAEIQLAYVISISIASIYLLITSSLFLDQN
jgi:hypothetical protein